MVGDDDRLPGALKRFDLTPEFCNLIRFVFTPDKDTTERFDNNHVGVKPTAVKLVKEFGSPAILETESPPTRRLKWEVDEPCP